MSEVLPQTEEQQQVSADEFLAPFLYEPYDEQKIAQQTVLENRIAKLALDAQSETLNDQLFDSTINYVLISVFATWAAFSLTMSAIVIYRWCRTLRLKKWNRLNAVLMMFVSVLLSTSSFSIYLVPVYVQVLLTQVLVSNLAYFWCVSFVLGLATDHSQKSNESSFARIRLAIIFALFLQVVAFMASFSHGIIGGQCEEDQLIPYLYDFMLGVQFLVVVTYIAEKLCGFGRRSKQTQTKEQEDLEKRKKKAVKSRHRHAKDGKEAKKGLKVEEIAHKEMSLMAFIYSFALSASKLALLLVGRIYIVNADDAIYCNIERDRYFITGDFGLVYLALFSFDAILTADFVRVTLYDGAVHSGAFKGVKYTLCSAALDKCRKRPEYLPEEEKEENEDRDQEPFEDQQMRDIELPRQDILNAHDSIRDESNDNSRKDFLKKGLSRSSTINDNTRVGN